MNASIIWYRARPSDELQLHLRDMLASVHAEAVEENVTIKSEQISSLMASAMRTSDITITVGGMDLRRDEENIVFLAAKCIRVPLELGRSSRSRYIYDPMRGAVLPSFEDAVLFPSASGGAEGAVLSTGSQTIIILPRLENSNTDIVDMIGEYLPMLIGLPEEPEPEPEEEPENHGDWTPDWDRNSDIPHKEYYDENGNRLPEYIERVLARKEHLKVDRDREITSNEIYTIFRDDESDHLAEDNLYSVYNDGDETASAGDNNAAASSPWERMFDAARRGEGRSASVQRYEELMRAPEPEKQPKAPSRSRKNREIDKFWGTEPLSGANRRENRPAPAPKPEKEKKPAKKADTPRTTRQPRPLASAGRKAASPNVNIELKNSYRPAESARRGAVLPEPSVPAEKTVGQATAPAFRAAAILLIVSIIISACYVAFSGYEPGILEEQKSFYQSELTSLFDPENTDYGDLPTGALARFSALYAENNDVCGYISIPGTDIAQPILRSYASSPDFYSHYSFYGSPDDRGSLYFDSGNVFEWGTSNYNLVVYGNSPSDGSMFAGLRKYTDAQYLAEHPLINLDTLYEKGQWIIFAVCIVSGDKVDEFNYSNTDFVGAYSHQIHLYNLYIRSMFYTNTEVLPDEQILTLITDSDAFTGAKLMVCGRKVRTDEDLSKAGASVIANPNVMMPDLWYALNNTEMPVVPELELPTETPTTAYTTLYPPTTTEAPTTTTAGTTAPTQPGETTSETTTTTTGTTVPTTLEATTAKNMRITSAGKIIEGKAEDVLAMIIEAEMGSGYELEALKAQAVAAYTYYLYAGGSAKAPSFPTKSPSDISLQAAREVLGQYMKHNGTVPYTPYYATSAGMTANNSDVNVAELSWLVSVDCSVDKNVAGFRTEKRMTALSVANRVMETKGIDLTTIEDKSTWFEVLERDANDLYVTSVRVGDEVYKGNTLHLSVLGYSYLRSPCFWIEYDESSDEFVFTSLGYGSGVGMSQTGANEYAKEGHNYVWILQHFYPGVTIKAN